MESYQGSYPKAAFAEANPTEASYPVLQMFHVELSINFLTLSD